MIAKLKNKWHDFKALPVGARFQTIHEQQADAPAWVKPVMVTGALGAFAVGIVLIFVPGPAVVFFALAGALAATESAWVARGLDSGEVAVRKLIAKMVRRRPKVSGLH